MTRYASLALLALAACSRPGGSSPEDVFEKAKSASEKKDWKTLYACFDPQESDSVLFAFVMVAGFATMGNEAGAKEIEAICQKHGVKKGDGSGLGSKEAQKKAAADAFSGVKDKPALFADLMTAVEKYAKEGSVTIVKGTLKDVKTDGDKATATMDKGDGKTDTMKFIRRDGRWYFAADE